jgi:hypothetical protein
MRREGIRRESVEEGGKGTGEKRPSRRFLGCRAQVLDLVPPCLFGRDRLVWRRFLGKSKARQREEEMETKRYQSVIESLSVPPPLKRNVQGRGKRREREDKGKGGRRARSMNRLSGKFERGGARGKDGPAKINAAKLGSAQ